MMESESAFTTNGCVTPEAKSEQSSYCIQIALGLSTANKAYSGMEVVCHDKADCYVEMPMDKVKSPVERRRRQLSSFEASIAGL